MHFYKTRIASLILAGVLAACSETSPPASDSATAMADAADWVLTNGQILTVDEDFSIVEAMAIKDGRILAN
jgi:hypothetical protein